jgi:hypothetical protein
MELPAARAGETLDRLETDRRLRHNGRHLVEESLRAATGEASGQVVPPVGDTGTRTSRWTVGGRP